MGEHLATGPTMPGPTPGVELTGRREAERSHPDLRLEVPRTHVPWEEEAC